MQFPPPEKIEKEVKIQESKHKKAKKKFPNQYSIKLPREIADYFKIKKGDKFKFEVNVETKENKFTIIRGDKIGKKKTIPPI